MRQHCQCNQGFPVISEVIAREGASFLAVHSCSSCEEELFTVELKPGMQIIATRDIANLEGNYVVPKGRMLRISAFGEIRSALTGFIFAGLFAVGAFSPVGFAVNWDIKKILLEGHSD